MTYDELRSRCAVLLRGYFDREPAPEVLDNLHTLFSHYYRQGPDLSPVGFDENEPLCLIEECAWSDNI